MGRLENLQDMLITHEREKLINTIIYFSQNTKCCGKTKLFKLLYFLDFEHFKVTGRSVTGLSYHAWKMGPVPQELFDEIESPEPDMAEALRISEIPTQRGRPMLTFNPTRAFSREHFTSREMRLLESLAKEYYYTSTDDMIEATHLENQPWHRVYEVEGNKFGEIPYEYVLRADEKEEMLRVVRDREELLEALA